MRPPEEHWRAAKRIDGGIEVICGQGLGTLGVEIPVIVRGTDRNRTEYPWDGSKSCRRIGSAATIAQKLVAVSQGYP
jgi:hypothetical protein